MGKRVPLRDKKKKKNENKKGISEYYRQLEERVL